MIQFDPTPPGDRQGTAVLRAEQWVPRPPGAVFPFFSDPRNLEVLTPPWLKFRVTEIPEGDLGEGSEIGYRLRVHGVSLGWRSRIVDWREGEQFSDVQLRGPYDLWHHTHRFVPDQGGTRLEDTVRFRLHGGMAAMKVLGRLVTADLRKIFNYRQAVIRELFPGKTDAGTLRQAGQAKQKLYASS